MNEERYYLERDTRRYDDQGIPNQNELQPTRRLGLLAQVFVGRAGLAAVDQSLRDVPERPGIQAAAMSAIQRSEPRTRIRLSHSRTQRDGWQYETTVEVEWFGDYTLDGHNGFERVDELLRHARILGEAERDIRNQRDREAHQQ